MQILSDIQFQYMLNRNESDIYFAIFNVFILIICNHTVKV